MSKVIIIYIIILHRKLKVNNYINYIFIINNTRYNALTNLFIILYKRVKIVKLKNKNFISNINNYIFRLLITRLIFLKNVSQSL